jgi:hypothetical protein
MIHLLREWNYTGPSVDRDVLVAAPHFGQMIG